jgi:hypothetical protein
MDKYVSSSSSAQQRSLGSGSGGACHILTPHQPSLNRHPTLLINDLKPGDVDGDLTPVDLPPKQGNTAPGMSRRDVSSTPLSLLNYPQLQMMQLRTRLWLQRFLPILPAPSVARISTKKKDALQNSDEGIINDSAPSESHTSSLSSTCSSAP